MDSRVLSNNKMLVLILLSLMSLLPHQVSSQGDSNVSSSFHLSPDVQPIHRHRKAGDGQLWVGITYVSSSISAATGGVCLDGSVPAYHFLKGSGSGVNNWHLHIEGGAWCESPDECAKRASTDLGSSSRMATSIPFTGLLNNNYQVNPDFYNWNHVYVRYCDGSSFTSDVSAPYQHSGQTLYFRGRRNFKAIIDDLKTKGLGSANQAFLTGCSAGGLSTIHRCNDMEYYLPGVTVKCLSDGGFFLNAPDTGGSYALYNFYNGVVNTHSLQNTLPRSCISSTKDATQCFFPQNMQNYISPPMFFVNGAYDFWQLENVKKLSRDQYSSCVSHSGCPNLNVLQSFRQEMLGALSPAFNRGNSGLFIDSCFSHCQVQGDDKWNNPKVNGKSTASSVGDWYFGRSSSHKGIDCAYPCNPTCVTRLD